MTLIYDCKCPTANNKPGYGLVYFYEFEDGHKYVGATRSFALWRRHGNHVRRERPNPVDVALQSGTPWRLSVLDANVPLAYLDAQEDFWIEHKRTKYDPETNPLGLNMQSGGIVGVTKTETSKGRISQAKKRYYSVPANRLRTARTVLQYTQDYKLVAIYPSTHDAQKITGCDAGNIVRACNGKQAHVHGYLWRYADIPMLTSRHPA